jgi:hypothetical protein
MLQGAATFACFSITFPIQFVGVAVAMTDLEAVH